MFVELLWGSFTAIEVVWEYDVGVRIFWNGCSDWSLVIRLRRLVT